MSTHPVTPNKSAAEASKAASANAKPVEQPKKTEEAKVDPDRVFRADGSEDTNATKERKLKKLASKRVPKAIYFLRKVGDLGAYKPNDEQKNKIVKVLRESFNEMEAKLQITSIKKSEDGFVL